MSKIYNIRQVNGRFVVRVAGVKLGSSSTRLGALVIAIRHQEALSS